MRHSRAMCATDAMRLGETGGHRMAMGGISGASDLPPRGTAKRYCAAMAAANPSAAARCWPGSTQLYTSSVKATDACPRR